MQFDEIAFQSDRQYRTIVIMWFVIMWFVFLISVSILFMFCFLLTPSTTDRFFSNFGFVLVALGLILIVDSFSWKRRFLARAVKEHDPSLVNRAYILAFAMCEAAGLFGVMLRFEGASRYYFVPFPLATVGMLF